MIKAVLIDIDNTLLDFGKCAEYAMKCAFEEYGLKFEEHICKIFHDVNDGLWYTLESGGITREEIYNTRWGIVFERLGITGIDGKEFEAVFKSYIAVSAIEVDGASELLKYLGERYTLCAASNSIYEQQIKRLTKAGMVDCFDKIFISDRIGFAKPSKEFFDACFNQLDGVSPAETVIIGDSLNADISGGIEYGMKTCWFNYKSESVPPDMKIDSIVNDLHEICRIL